MKFTRDDYMSKKCSHHEYYLQWVTEATKQLVLSRFKDRIKTSTNEHFNDIPLVEWDNLTPCLYHYPDNSLASKVCILKAAAREIRGH